MNCDALEAGRDLDDMINRIFFHLASYAPTGFPFSTETKYAFALVYQMHYEKALYVGIESFPSAEGDMWRCDFDAGSAARALPGFPVTALAPTLPLAICRAAMKVAALTLPDVIRHPATP